MISLNSVFSFIGQYLCVAGAVIGVGYVFGKIADVVWQQLVTAKETAEFVLAYRSWNSNPVAVFIRDPQVIWYGPHVCENCASPIVRAELAAGGMKLDAPHDSQYPNHKWTMHSCPATAPKSGPF